MDGWTFLFCRESDLNAHGISGQHWIVKISSTNHDMWWCIGSRSVSEQATEYRLN